MKKREPSMYIHPVSIHVSSTCWSSLWNEQNQILQTLYDIFELDEISDSIGTDFAVWIIISFFSANKERIDSTNKFMKEICIKM